MDFEWVALAVSDVSWIGLAFALGFLVKQINLPPLVGFLATGFILNYFGVNSGEMLAKLADLGITLLLFTVGLKLNLKVLAKPHVWALSLIHIAIITGLFGLSIFALALLNISLFSGLSIQLSLMLAFALSFSSTVFVVKVLEEKAEINSLQGRIAVGILIIQDLAAVAFLAASTGQFPHYYALGLVLLIPLRPLFLHLLEKTGHGELLILYGLVLALGGAELFNMGGVKDDLGALFMGILISAHSKSVEMSKAMLGLKDLFLVGFFLSVGMAGDLSWESLLLGLALVPFVLIKSSLFFLLMTQFKLRARTSLLSTLSLTNYSEFGLIVTAIGVSSGWLKGDWLVIISIALSASFVFSAWLNKRDNKIYTQYKQILQAFQSKQRLEDDRVLDIQGTRIAIFGMGRIGTGAYDKMRELHGAKVLGIDFDVDKVKKHRHLNRKVVNGDPSDADFWDRVKNHHEIDMVMLALPNIESNLSVLERLREIEYSGCIAATVKYHDQAEILREAGATAVFNIFTEAGIGFANLAEQQL